MKHCKLIQDKKGQGMTEYIIILALIAIASVKVVQVFGESISVAYTRVVASLQGQTYDEKSYDDFDLDEATKSRDLSNFDE